jgi:hypothetical protein
MDVATPHTIRSVSPDLPQKEVKEVKDEGNLVIEAVSLLVQRQREMESWVAEQIWQAEERGAAAERRYAEVEERLAGIEDHLARLVHEVEPSRTDAGLAERLSRLREQVEGLKASGDGGPLPHEPHLSAAPGSAVAPRDEAAEPVAFAPPAGPAAGVAPAGRAVPRYETRVTARPPAAAAVPGGQRLGFWDLLGTSRDDRLGVVLIGAGAVALLYAILTLLRLG